MKITFIRPSIGAARSRDAMEPLAFASLAALTPRDIQRVCYDERIEALPLDEPTDLVALTVETYTARRAYQIAAHYRARGIPVVMGGYHVSFLPEEALRWANAVVIGDAEGVWSKVIQDAQAGRLERTYRQQGQLPLAGLQFDRRIFAGKRYGFVAPVQYGRGCRFACDFCSIHAFYGSNVRTRPVAEVVAEIKALGRKNILLVDDNLFVNVDKARELFEALIPLRISWGCQVSIDVVRDVELVRLMARSGCIAALIGFESLSATNLAQMKKKWNLKGGTYRDAVKVLHAHGIMIYGSFMFGYDDDTTETFESTAQFAIDTGMFLVNFAALTPMPGTKLLERMRSDGRMVCDQWWLDPSYRYGQATFQPARMSVDDLTNGRARARWLFYGHSSIARRFFHRANRRSFTNAGIFLSANYISRAQFTRKLGYPLGGTEPLSSDSEEMPRVHSLPVGVA